MILHLIRHANARNKSTSGKDFDRTLSVKGGVEAIRLQTFVNKIELSNTDIYISSSQRTMETSSIALTNELFSNAVYLDELYLASSEMLLKFIYELNTEKDILLIGHNEGISSLASYLTNQYIGLGTANYVGIDFPFLNSNLISKGTGTIVRFFEPNS
jgi:phosphohistidine phosphatase